MSTKKVNGMRKSKYCSNYSPVYVSDGMSGKLEGVPAISTSCLHNKFCIKRYKSGVGICAKCFAVATQNCRKNLEKCLLENEILKQRILLKSELPIFRNVQIVRFESFGDLENEMQFLNYYNIAKINPTVRFALWSKNPWLVQKAFEKWELPKLKNLTIVLSSFELNKERKLLPCFDKVFTVYEKSERKPSEINCGARDCASCQRCYKKTTTPHISEYLK